MQQKDKSLLYWFSIYFPGIAETKTKNSSGNPKMYATCFVCGKQLSNQYNLRVHMETHQNAHYACSACNHVSRSRDALRKHVSYRHPQTPASLLQPPTPTPAPATPTPRQPWHTHRDLVMRVAYPLLSVHFKGLFCDLNSKVHSLKLLLVISGCWIRTVGVIQVPFYRFIL